jgi:sn-glycerol 3-phosphate transport system permease protein
MANMPIRALFNHAILIAGVIFLVAPIALIFFSSTHDTGTLLRDGLQMNWGGQFYSKLPDNYLF